MARDILCDVCGQEPAVEMHSDLTNGQTTAVGAECALAYLILMCQKAGLVALPADLVPAEMGGTLVTEPTPTEGTTKARKPRRRAAEPAPEVAQDPDTDEVTDEPTDEPSVYDPTSGFAPGE